MSNFIGFGNDTLDKLPQVKVGDKFICGKCGKEHILFGGEDGSTLILSYYCSDGNMYLGAVHGRLIVYIEPDVKGRL